MLCQVLPRARQRVTRTLLGLVALGSVLAVWAISANGAGATTHDYCFWDGSYSANTAGVKCFASGDNFLTTNSAWLVYSPTLPTIFCGANLGGSPYGAAVGGNPSCAHAYSGANLLKAWEYVDISATTHGRIYY